VNADGGSVTDRSYPAMCL